MKRNSLLVITITFLAAACAQDTWIKVKVEMPGVPAVRLEAFQEIVLADFWMENDVEEFNLNRELLGYFEEECKKQFKGRITSRTVAWENADQVKNRDFWKQTFPELRDGLVLTGKAQFIEENRKALIGGDKRPIDEGPFGPKKAWAERKNFTLKLDIYILKPETGEILFENNYQETMNYENLKHTADFAFADLLDKIKIKFFRALLGSERVQERYLLSR
jgi:hypothetical protein